MNHTNFRLRKYAANRRYSKLLSFATIMQFLLADFLFVLSHCYGSKRRTIASRICMAPRDENRAREFRKGL